MSEYIVKLSSKVISYEWWGQQWCKNIANYADYYNRLERGRTYIRKGAIKELRIEEGHINAIVAGATVESYHVEINIKPASKNIVDYTLKQIKDINMLRNGVVPENYRKLFSIDKGLFPTLKEIEFSCSCPDVACLCKHIAAVLYAIGSILDQEPLILLHLRGIKVEEYLDRKLIEVTNEMLIDINSRSEDERVIKDDMLELLFGIDIATGSDETFKQGGNSDAEEDHVIELLPKSKRKKIEVPKIKKNLLEGYYIRQFDLNGNYIAQFSSYEELEAKTSAGVINIRRACSGLKKSAGGYQWRKVSNKEPITNILPLQKNVEVVAIRPLDCFDDEGNFIAHYDSIKAASRAIGVNAKSIREAAKGIQKHAGGYKWKFSDEQ